MPTRALYYPEWSISDPEFLVESLLFWDRLAVLVPMEGFRGGVWHQDPETNRLLNRIHDEHVTPIVPTDAQKRRVHDRLSLIFERDAPEYLQPENLSPSSSVTLAADKFSPDTMELLTRQRWLHRGASIGNVVTYEVSQAAANVVMAALANECSSADMPPITRDAGGFVATCNALLGELGAPRGLALGERVDAAIQTQVEGEVAFLLEPISHLGIRAPVTARDVGCVLKARNDPDIEGRRKEFVAKVDAYLTKLRKAEGGERTVIRDEFAEEFNRAQAALVRELGSLGLRTLFSKEGLCAIVVGLAAGSVVPSLGLALGLMGTTLEYREKRREVLDSNWSAWAYDVRSGGLRLK